MVEPVLKQQDIKLMLKASIDYNSFVMGIVAQVVENGAKPKRVFRELERANKQYRKVVESIMEKYDYNPAAN